MLALCHFVDRNSLMIADCLLQFAISATESMSLSMQMPLLAQYTVPQLQSVEQLNMALLDIGKDSSLDSKVHTGFVKQEHNVHYEVEFVNVNLQC